MQSTPSSSGESAVRGLIRKYSSDSEASPPSAKPPEKRKYGINGTMSNPSTTAENAGTTGIPAVATSTGAETVTIQAGHQTVTHQVAPLQAVTDFTSLGVVLQQINTSLTSIASEVHQTRQSLSARISNIEQSLTSKISSECEKIRTDLIMQISAVDAKVISLRTSVDTLDQELKASNDRLRRVEDALAAADALTPDYYPETTIIATKLPYDNPEDIKQKAQNLVNALTAACEPPLPHIDVVNAMRTPFRDNKPGVVKIQLPSRQNKIDILKNKKKLMDNDNYKRVFIRGSQSHTDRLIQINTNTLLNELGLNDKYRVAANGRLVLNDNAQRPGHDQQPHEQRPPWNRHPHGPPGPPGPRGHFDMQGWPPPGQWYQPNGQRPPAPHQNRRY